MIRSKRRTMVAANQLVIYFTDKGKILTQGEYETALDTPIRYRDLVKFFRTYDLAVQFVKQHDTGLETRLAPKPKPAKKPAVKKGK